MAKKPLTMKQKQIKYRALQHSTLLGEIVSVLMPFVILGIVNAQDWFYQDEGWKVGLGGTLALALLGIAIMLVTKEKTKDNPNFSFVVLVVGWFAVTFVFILLGDIINQIAIIMFFGGLGLASACGLEFVRKDLKGKADLCKNIIEKGKEKVMQEQVEQELKNNDVRF